MPLAASGVTVLALEQAVAVPFATRQLADLGARVIKIERPVVGDFARGYDTTVQGLASHFVWLNRSKESLTLDLKRPEAQTWFCRGCSTGPTCSCKTSRPARPIASGSAREELRARYPRMIVCNLSGYGSTGPYAAKKAYDLLVQSEVGLVSITGTPDTPSKVGLSIADIAGGMYAYSGILTALLQRERTGQGTALEVSLFERSASGWVRDVLHDGRDGACQDGCEPRDHRALRAVPAARRSGGHLRHAEQPRVGHVLQGRPRSAGSGRTMRDFRATICACSTAPR